MDYNRHRRAMIIAQEFIPKPTAIVSGPTGISLHIVPQGFIEQLVYREVSKAQAMKQKRAFLNG